MSSFIVHYILPNVIVLTITMLYYKRVSSKSNKDIYKKIEEIEELFIEKNGSIFSPDLSKKESGAHGIKTSLEDLNENIKMLDNIVVTNSNAVLKITNTLKTLKKQHEESSAKLNELESITNILNEKFNITDTAQGPNKEFPGIKNSVDDISKKFKELKAGFMLNSDKINQVHEILNDHEVNISRLNTRSEEDVVKEKWTYLDH